MNDLDELIAEARNSFKATNSSASLIRRLADALEAATSERDAALAAVARVQETLSLHNPNGRLVKEVLAALDGAPEPEVRWEYGAKVYNSGRVVRIEDSPKKVRLGMSATSYTNPQWVDDVLVRRRKAGPWIPVEGESK